jgi:hypothetical protein
MIAVTLGLLAHGMTFRPAELVMMTVLLQIPVTALTTPVLFQFVSSERRSDPSDAQDFKKTRQTSGMGRTVRRPPEAAISVLFRMYCTSVPSCAALALIASSGETR